MQNDIAKMLKTHLSEIKERFKVKEIGVFGSYVKGKAKKRSDVDILVEFEQEGETFDNYMELKFFLEKLFKRKVDLAIKNALREEIKEEILLEAVYV